MGRRPKGLRTSKIFFSILNLNWSWIKRLRNRYLSYWLQITFLSIWRFNFSLFKNRVGIGLRFIQLLLGLLKDNLGIWKLQRKFLIFLFWFFESFCERSNFTIFCNELAAQIINVCTGLRILGLRALDTGSNELIFQLVHEFVELGRPIDISPHKLTLEEHEQLSADSLDVLVLIGRVATLRHRYLPLPDSCE